MLKLTFSPLTLTMTFGKCKKVNYKSEPTASKAVEAMAKKGVEGLEPYNCDCGGWHIGHSMAIQCASSTVITPDEPTAIANWES